MEKFRYRKHEQPGKDGGEVLQMYSLQNGRDEEYRKRGYSPQLEACGLDHRPLGKTSQYGQGSPPGRQLNNNHKHEPQKSDPKPGAQQTLNQRHTPEVKERQNVEDVSKGKQHTNWNGVLQDLFGVDMPRTAESSHESTSSGVASDVTSLYPPTPIMTSFTGGDSAGSAKSMESCDSGTKSVSASSSPRPGQPFKKPYPRRHPATPLPLIPKDAPGPPGRNATCQANSSPMNGYHLASAYCSSPVAGLKEMNNSKECRPRLADGNCIQCLNINNRFHTQQRNACTSSHVYDHRAMHPAFCCETDHCCMENMRDVQFIEAVGDSRCIESHFEENCAVKARVYSGGVTLVSPVQSPGYCCGQQGYHHNSNIHLKSDATVRSPKMWYKDQQLHSHNRRHSPTIKDLNPNIPSDMYSHHNHRISPSPQGRINNFSSPQTCQTPQVNTANRTACEPYGHQPIRPHQSKYKTSEYKPDLPVQRSQTPKGSQVLLTQAQVHTPQPDAGRRKEAKTKLSYPQTESNVNVCQDKTQFGRQSDSTLYLVTGINHVSSNPSGKHLIPQQSTAFDILGNDVLLKIFSHLPTDQLCRCSQVCRHWYNVVWDHPILWTSIIINNQNIDIDRALKYLTRRLSYNTPKVCMILEKININACSQLSDHGLHTVAKRCPELRYLNMQNCPLVSNAGVKEVVSRCVNLERLDVTGCPLVTCISLTDSLISQSASRHLQRIYLRYLDLTDCPSVTDQDLSIMTSQCTQLLFFYLRRCTLITDLGVTYIANNCTSLRELSLSDCKNVTDLGMRELAKLHESLRYLSVAKCEKVSDQGVIHVARNCTKLRYLNVRGCEAFSDTGLEFLARNCPRLRSLDIGKCDITDDGLYALSMYCPNLRKLGVKSCDAITDKGIVLIAYRCSSLQQLHVQDCCLSPDAYAMVRKYCKRAIIEHTNPAIL